MYCIAVHFGDLVAGVLRGDQGGDLIMGPESGGGMGPRCNNFY